jgi:hypothetical protein
MQEKHEREDDVQEKGAEGDGPVTPAHAYQEGSVETVGGGPSGTDTDDRTGQPPVAPATAGRPVGEANRDIFISSEVAEESAHAPGRPERTRS